MRKKKRNEALAVYVSDFGTIMETHKGSIRVAEPKVEEEFTEEEIWAWYEQDPEGWCE